MADDVQAAFSASVRRERLARRWSMDALSRKADVTKATISNIEGGRNSTSLHVAARLAGAFGMTIDSLISSAAGGGS